MDHFSMVLSVVLFLVRRIAALHPTAGGRYWQRNTATTKYTTRSFLRGTVKTTKSVTRTTVTLTRKNFKAPYATLTPFPDHWQTFAMPRSPEEQRAYDTGWNLREMGHLDMLDTYQNDPKLRRAFEQGWADAAKWQQEKDQSSG